MTQLVGQRATQCPSQQHLPFARRAQPACPSRIEQPNGFEFAVAEIGRGWSTARGPVSYELADTYGQFAHIHLCQSGMVR